MHASIVVHLGETKGSDSELLNSQIEYIKKIELLLTADCDLHLNQLYFLLLFLLGLC